MIVGCPKEIKTLECRVGLTPSGVKALVKDGNKVLIEKGAGLGSGFSDEEYKRSGAELIEKAEDLYAGSQIIVKVKEPLESEFRFFRPGLIFFTYFHLASDKALTKALLKKKVTALAYETYVDENETVPMSRTFFSASFLVSKRQCPSCQRNSEPRRKGRVVFSQRTTEHHWL